VIISRKRIMDKPKIEKQKEKVPVKRRMKRGKRKRIDEHLEEMGNGIA
jgi:hypothetical protein